MGDSFSTSDIGKYFSALSNEANLRERDAGWLVFGVRNKTREVVGTDYRRERERLHGLKHQIAQNTDPTVTFREIHELETARGRGVLFEIPPAPRGIPIAWNGHYYARDGESLGSLGLAKLDEIRAQGLADDWSALVVEDARPSDLDAEALAKARTLFAATLAQSHRLDPESVAAWSDGEFLENAGLARRGGLTRACLILLGKPQAAALINPYVAEMTWKLEGDEIAYEHFQPPFLLNTSRLFQRIRNLRLSPQPPGQLIPVDIATLCWPRPCATCA